MIVGNKNIEIKNVAVNDVKAKDVQSNKQDSVSTGIELPGFIRKQTTNLKRSLRKIKLLKIWKIPQLQPLILMIY